MINHPNLTRKRRAVAAAAVAIHDHDADYVAFRAGVAQSFADAISDGSKLFATDTEGLFDIFLKHMPPAERQIHTCNTCRQFFRAFGGLVTISAVGESIPAMWAAAPQFYSEATGAMSKTIAHARVRAPFSCTSPVWGIPNTGAWEHIAVMPPSAILHRDKLLTPGQRMAAKHEDFGTVARALADFTPAMLDEALRLLEADAVNRAEKFIGPVRWLLDLHTARTAQKNARNRDNILWRAIGSAPDGYCHPRASVIGPLLEGIAAGEPFEKLRASFNAMTHGLRYQRPQAAPTAGNLLMAEKIVEKLGIAPSLERRFARLDECEAIWTPRVYEAKPATGSVFGHLATKDSAPDPLSVSLPTQTMTWAKFAASALPTAEGIELLTPHGHGNFIALLTAAKPDAPPILRWDRDDARNPVSVYVYHNGSAAHSWGLAAGTFIPVTAVVPRPNLWGARPLPHLGEGLILVLKGAVDQKTNQGNALFPETLREELHQVRATIEAYSKRAEIGGREEASACGYSFNKGAIGVNLRVLVNGRHTTYRIDRWD